jgi:hypothetical protein
MIVTSRRAVAAGAWAAVMLALVLVLHGVIFAVFAWFAHPWRFAGAITAALILTTYATYAALVPSGEHAAPRRVLAPDEGDKAPKAIEAPKREPVYAGHSANWQPDATSPGTAIIDYDDGFDHRLDDQFARLRDSTLESRPDLAAELNALPPAVVVTDDPAGRHARPRVHPFAPDRELRPYCSKCGTGDHWRGEGNCPDKSIDELITRRREDHVSAAIAGYVAEAGFRSHGGDTDAMLDSIIGGIEPVKP